MNTNFRNAIKKNRLSDLIQEAAAELKKLSTSDLKKGLPQVVDLLKVKVKNGVNVVSELISIYQRYVKTFVGQRVNLSDFKKSVEKYEKKHDAIEDALKKNVASDIFASSADFADESLKVHAKGSSAIESALKGGAKGYTEETAAAFNAAYAPALAQAEATVNAAVTNNAVNQAALNSAAAQAATTAANANAQAAQAAAEAAQAAEAAEAAIPAPALEGAMRRTPGSRPTNTSRRLLSPMAAQRPMNNSIYGNFTNGPVNNASASAQTNNAPELTTLYNEKPVAQNVSQNVSQLNTPLLLTNRSPENAAAAKAANNAAKAAQNAANAAAVNAAKTAVAAQNANIRAADAAQAAAANAQGKLDVLDRIAKARAVARPPPGLPPQLAKLRRNSGIAAEPGLNLAYRNSSVRNNSSTMNGSVGNNASVGNASVGNNASAMNGSVGNNSLENNSEFKQMNASRNSQVSAGLLNGYTPSEKNELNVLSNKISANLLRMTNDSVTLRKKANDIKNRLSLLNKSILASGKKLMGSERAAMMARVMAILRELDGKVQGLNSTTPGLRDELVDIETTLAQLEAQYQTTKQDGGRRSRKQQKKQKNRKTQKKNSKQQKQKQTRQRK